MRKPHQIKKSKDTKSATLYTSSSVVALVTVLSHTSSKYFFSQDKDGCCSGGGDWCPWKKKIVFPLDNRLHTSCKTCYLLAPARREFLKSDAPIQHASKTEVPHARTLGHQESLQGREASSRNGRGQPWEVCPQKKEGREFRSNIFTLFVHSYYIYSCFLFFLFVLWFVSITKGRGVVNASWVVRGYRGYLARKRSSHQKRPWNHPPVRF